MRALAFAGTFGAHLFVVDTMIEGSLVRVLGSITLDGADEIVRQQSAMDLARPTRLVFRYERLMALAFSLTGVSPKRALLLGVGGGSMLRYLAHHAPALDILAVDSDETVLDLARRFFAMRREVLVADAMQVVADARGAPYDVVLVDLYAEAGASHVDQGFLLACLDLVRPRGGCVAVNWADFSIGAPYEPTAQALVEAAAGSLFVTARDFTDNLIQFSWTDPALKAESVQTRLSLPEPGLAGASQRLRLLRSCHVSETYPQR